MNALFKHRSLLTALLVMSSAGIRAEEKDTALMKAVSMDAGSKVSATDRKLMQQSIQTTKDSIARDTLEVFYRDAQDYYHAGDYDAALNLLDQIYSLNPYYENVGTLRETILQLKNNHEVDSKRSVLDDYMRKGNQAASAGQNIAAINFWKQALSVSPNYKPAKNKIEKMNSQLGQKQYEIGYLAYQQGNMEEALDSWSNAIALDPKLKDRGLLLLMTKVDIALKKDQILSLTTQADQQYSQNDYAGSLQTYEQLLSVDPRNQEARRMEAKLKVQLGNAAYNSAQSAMSRHQYAEAITHYQDAVRYGFEIQKSGKGIRDAERAVKSDEDARIAKRDEKPAPPPTAQPSGTPVPGSGAAVAANPEQARLHYQQGLAAIHSKDMRRAVEELEIARQLNPNDEYIYVALERAKQAAAGATAPGTPTP